MMLFNGEPCEGGWTATRALHYGDGVFRTGLVVDGRLVDRDRQLRKLADDAATLDLDIPAGLATRVDSVCAQAGQAVLRITLSRAGNGRGYRPGGRACDELLELRPLPDEPAARWIHGITMGWSAVLLGIQPRLAGIKHLNRLEQVLASRGWPQDQHEVLMCDAEGRVTCGSKTNVFFVIDGILVTPDVSRAGVAGMMRDKLIDLARPAGVDCAVGLVSPDELRHASECFVTNSVLGVWPVRRIGTQEFEAPGPVTQVVSRALQHPWAGR